MALVQLSPESEDSLEYHLEVLQQTAAEAVGIGYKPLDYDSAVDMIYGSDGLHTHSVPVLRAISGRPEGKSGAVHYKGRTEDGDSFRSRVSRRGSVRLDLTRWNRVREPLEIMHAFIPSEPHIGMYHFATLSGEQVIFDDLRNPSEEDLSRYTYIAGRAIEAFVDALDNDTHYRFHVHHR